MSENSFVEIEDSKLESVKLAKAAGIISAATFVSRVLGFIRDMVVAGIFGATWIADAFFVAFRIPNFLRELFAEGSMSAGFIPVFTEYLEKKGHKEAKKFVEAVFTVFVIIILAVTILGIIFSPVLVKVTAPGFSADPERYNLTVFLTRLMFPYLFFIGLAALSMGILNTLGVFAPPAFSPAVYNIAMISFLLGLTPFLKQPVIGLAAGVIVGGALQFFIQMPALMRKNMFFKFSPELAGHPGVKQVGKLIIPIFIGLSATQINLLANTIMASYLKTGSISYLYYAMRLIQFPLGIFGVAIATAILPLMSRYSIREDKQGLVDTVSFGLRFTFFITVPAMIGLVFLREPIVNLLYQHGEFDYEATKETSKALLVYACGLWSFAGVRIVSPAFYSMKDTITPVKVSIIAVGINIAVSLIMIKPLEHAGLALGTVVSSVFNICALLYILRKKVGLMGGRRIAISFIKISISSAVIMLIGIYISSMPLWAVNGKLIIKSTLLFSAIIISIISYFLCHYYLKSEEFKFFNEIAISKIQKRLSK